MDSILNKSHPFFLFTSTRTSSASAYISCVWWPTYYNLLNVVCFDPFLRLRSPLSPSGTKLVLCHLPNVSRWNIVRDVRNTIASYEYQLRLIFLCQYKVAMKVSESVEGKGLDRPEFLRAAQAALKGGRYQT